MRYLNLRRSALRLGGSQHFRADSRVDGRLDASCSSYFALHLQSSVVSITSGVLTHLGLSLTFNIERIRPHCVVWISSFCHFYQKLHIFMMRTAINLSSSILYKKCYQVIISGVCFTTTCTTLMALLLEQCCRL